jgi:hypothetical protein
MTLSRWESGDRVVHTARPEWGVGKVLSATSIRQDGQDAQRLTIRFDRAGTKTLSTAVARLAQADSMPVQVFSRPDPGEDHDAFAPADHAASLATLVSLPDAATDPFLPLSRRLEATVALYRFSAAGASLLDWAASQTQLADPLSAFSRHELEEGFTKFRATLDGHLRKLVTDASRQDPSVLAGLGAKVPPEIRQMLTRLLTQR